MNPIQLLFFKKQCLVTAPNWLGSVLLHLLIVAVVAGIGDIPTRKTEIVWVNLSNIALELPEPGGVPNSEIIAPKQAQPEATIPVAPTANAEDVAIKDSLPEPEEQSVTQNITIEPKLMQLNRSIPLKIRKAGRAKQKMSRSADSPSIIVPQGEPEKVTTVNPSPAAVRTKILPVKTKDTPVAAESRYLQANFTKIRNKVGDNLRYPAMARRQGWQGQVQVRFNILLSGEIDNLQVLSSSGYSLLDRQAIQAVKLAAPFAVPPVSASITIPVTFLLN